MLKSKSKSKNPRRRRDRVRLDSGGIREAQVEDLAAIVKVHQMSFPGFFLTQLGTRFLTELYRGFLTHALGFCSVIEREQSVVGFVAGTIDPKNFFRSLLWRRGLFFLLAAFPALIRHPLLIGRRLLSAVTYRGESQQLDANGALLSSLAVLPSSSGRGEGSRLVRQFCNVAQEQGSDYVYLTTDRENNDAVNNFYQKLGFLCHSKYEASGGRRMNCYVLRLDS